MHIYVVVDTETTGLDPENGDSIIEIAAVPVYKGKIYKKHMFHALVNPIVRVPAVVTSIHGLKNSDLESYPTMHEVLPRFIEYVGSAVLVMHNAVMDLSFLDAAAKSVGRLPPFVRYVDTLEIAKYLYPKESHSLMSLANKYRIKVEKLHRAKADALLTAKVFLRMLRLLGEDEVRGFIKIWKGVG